MKNNTRFSICLLFLWMSMSFCLAAETYSQETFFTIESNNLTVKEVFNKIEKESEYIFFRIAVGSVVVFADHRISEPISVNILDIRAVLFEMSENIRRSRTAANLVRTDNDIVYRYGIIDFLL